MTAYPIDTQPEAGASQTDFAVKVATKELGKPVPEPVKTESLVYADGTPTPKGWREIGVRFRAEMPTRERPGRGNQKYAYITARQVGERLDEVVGPGNWSTSFRLLHPDLLAVECTLTIFGVSKADVGFPNSSDPGEAEPLKAAYSDALKRAAVQWSIGRWLYDND